MSVDNKAKKEYDLKLFEDKKDSYNPLDIWRVNPTSKDISMNLFKVKIIFLAVILLFFTITTLFLTHNALITLISAIFIVILFLTAFHNEIYSLEHGFKLIFHKFSEIKPYENIKFYMLEGDPATVIIINKKDMLTIATRIFKVEILAENVNPNMDQFLYALDQSKTPYSYQVVQKPIIKFADNLSQDKVPALKLRDGNSQGIDTYQTHIYFSVYHVEKGILTKRKLAKLIDTIILYSKDIKSNFAANLHHTKISLLTKKDDLLEEEENQDDDESNEDDEDPIQALRTIICRTSVDVPFDDEVDSEKNTVSWNHIIRLIFSLIIISYLSYILILLNIPLLYFLGINLAVSCLIIFLWWRELLFHLTNFQIKSFGISEINPFSDVKFYSMNKCRDTLFIYVNNRIIIASKMFNLKEAIQPSFAMPDKFFSAMINQNTPFVYTVNATPIEIGEFSRKCTKKLNDKTKEDLEGIIFHPLDKTPVKRHKYPEAEYLNWMEKRTGIWKTIATISTSSHKLTNASTIGELIKDFYDLEEKLYYNAKNLMGQYQQNFKKLSLTQLQGHSLITGFQSECIKNMAWRLSGTHLKCVYFQGKKLKELTNLANQFKKGIEVKIAAEFNTPLYLENDITIGHAINTEFLEKEALAGFKVKQLRQLLITNGTSGMREHLKMKIVAELTRANIASLIFDYTGDWSKLIRYFKDSPYEEKFVHFKFGQSFNVNLIYSGIQYDSDNHEFLNYFYDVFTLAFKAQRYTTDLIKKTLRENKELDWGSLATAIQNTPDYNKRASTESVRNLFIDFIDQSVFFSDKAREFENDIAPLDFIKTDKTVIIDLSLLKDLEQQIFATFIILSKFVHYINHSNEYHEKILFIPHLDMFFDQYFIDNYNSTINYGKIDKLLAPLIQNGFGLVFSANQIHYLHPNVFNYMRNIITFQATDSRDIAVLKNNMHLQELHGTGYYSSKRNETYQIQYLMSIRNNEIIVKRDDIYQPFPVKVEWNQLVKMLPLSTESIYKHMEEQGYKLKLLEQKLMAKLKRTLFEKDFGIYSAYIDDVKNFLESIKKFDGIAINKDNINKGLLESIKQRASKRTRNRDQIIAIRNDLFDLLLEHGYLVTRQSRMPSGGDAVYTSYAIGAQYQKALDDEMEVRRNQPVQVEIEAIDMESESKPQDIFSTLPFQEEFDVKKFHRALRPI